MPRTFDFDYQPLPGERRDSLFKSFSEARQGEGEVETNRFLAHFMDAGPRAQFEYSPGPGLEYYSNATIEPVFAWLQANTTCSWHWFESETNHGHSVSIEVWVDNPVEAALFMGAWGDRFKEVTWALKGNDEVRGDRSETPGFERATGLGPSASPR